MGMRKVAITGALLCIWLGVYVVSAHAAFTPELSDTVEVAINPQVVDNPENFRYGVGFQSTFPAWGLSGTMQITDEISGQLILGPFGILNTFAGRGLYSFQEEQYWNLYGYGMLGVWTYNYIGSRRESSLGIGAGAGIQYDWRAWNDELPPLFWNLELGLGFVNLDHYNFNSVMLGTGVHYRF